MSLPKVILLDGLGINAKTWLCGILQDEGIHTLTSNSRFYESEARHLLPHTLKYTTRFETRLHEISAVQQTLQNEPAIVVDRSAFNQIIFGKLNYDKILVNYILDDEDHNLLIKNFSKYRKLEDEILGNVERHLISTRSKFLINKALDWSQYEVEPHATARIDAFEDYEHYCNIRNVYDSVYLNCCNMVNLHYIDEDWNEPEIKNFVESFANELICKIRS